MATDAISKAKSEFVMSHEQYSPNQHCTADDCYTFSHTAQWCGADQPRFCACAFDYPHDSAATLNEDMRQTLINKVLSDCHDDLMSI